eukprot:TRINITY_DN2983_c0_g1_i4.p1 TRINITY_DN2983_c0_g1~~TRINITY_DN2983_c0_g1_i4.p1  ORF type:complete len:557 (-),score=130.22 TRINITY_DN2983_c0_g1_i4:45-1715(-)
MKLRVVAGLVVLLCVCRVSLSAFGRSLLDVPDFDTKHYEQRVTPEKADNGTVYDENGEVMIYRNGSTVYVRLTVDICRYEEHIAFNTRCYNGKFVGPTITVKQGDTLEVTVINDLGPETTLNYEMNELHWPNTTSLHFHGIHASPNEDNPFSVIYPGESSTITVHIEDDHYPGIHWYHAHYHGSSVYQIFGGMHGAFVIEPAEPETFYTDFFKQMREIVLVISNLKMYSFDNGGWHGFIEYAGLIGDEIDLDLELDYSSYNNTFAINGKYQPVIDIAVDEWNWLRIVNAGASLVIPLRVNSAFCEHYAIGADGVFLDNALSLEAYYIFPGSRLDLAIKCSEFGNHSLVFWKDPDNFWIYRGVDSGESQLLFNLNADREADVTPLEISSYEVPTKPSYLDDLRLVPDDEIEATYEIESVFVDEDWDQFGFNDMRWAGTGETTLFSLEIGKVYEIKFTTDFAVHPIHVHINHMQVVSDEQVSWSNFSTFALHQEGTWRDTIYSSFERNVTVRVRPSKFTGYALVHCHYVIHADRGMMAEIEITDSTVDNSDDDDSDSS